MTPERRARLVALGKLHDQWVDGALPDAGFHPGQHPAGSDYQQHNADLDAAPQDEDAFHRRARAVMGLDPDTGQRATQ
jgi:hypothetical protein